MVISRLWFSNRAAVFSNLLPGDGCLRKCRHLGAGCRREWRRPAQARILVVEVRQVPVERHEAVAPDKAEQLLANESAVEAKQEGFNAGLNTNIDVLDAQRDLFRAQRDHLRSRYDYILNRLALEAVVGDLRRDDIVQVNSWLQ